MANAIRIYCDADRTSREGSGKVTVHYCKSQKRALIRRLELMRQVETLYENVLHLILEFLTLLTNSRTRLNVGRFGSSESIMRGTVSGLVFGKLDFGILRCYILLIFVMQYIMTSSEIQQG